MSQGDTPISGICEGGATQSAGMHRRPNAAGLSPRAVNIPVSVHVLPSRPKAADQIGGQEDDRARMTVHEWGTFTSIAGDDGRAVEWLPMDGPTDLPCFVDRLRFNLKGSLSGTVRMET